MVKMVFGSNGGNQFVKVLKNSADDPLTTPDNDYGKFLFNSNNQNLGYVLGTRADYASNPDYAWGGPDSSGSKGIERFFPAGSDITNFDIYTMSKNYLSNPQLYYILNIRKIFGDFGDPDFAPMIDVVGGTSSSRIGAGMYYQPNYGDSGGGAGNEAGYWASWNGAITSGQANPGDTPSNPVANNYPAPRPFLNMINPVGGDIFGTTVKVPNVLQFMWDPTRYWNVSVWDIPGNDMPMNPVAPPPTPGDEVVSLDSTGLKIARRGFSVTSTNPREFIINTQRIPVKIQRVGTATLAPSGSTTVTTPFPISSNCVVDMMMRHTTESWMYPSPVGLYSSPGSWVTAAVNYAVTGPNSIVISNTTEYTIEITYVVYDDSQPITSGGTQVFRQVDGEYIQIKRPGSSDTDPSLSDIALDTRLPTLTCVNEGFIPYTDMTEPPTSANWANMAKTIHLDNDGTWRPFVKYTTVYDLGGGKTGYKPPCIRMFFTNRPSPYLLTPARQSSVAEIRNDWVKFNLTRDNPFYIQANSSLGSYTALNAGEPNPIGIRYYIFAIPNTL